LNPFRKEFPAYNPFERFPKAFGLRSNTAAESDFIKYISALTEYFRVAPYRSWFGWFEELLNWNGRKLLTWTRQHCSSH